MKAYKLDKREETVTLPPCPYCGADVEVSEDWGFDPDWPQFIGYDVDCYGGCKRGLWHLCSVSGQGDVEELIEAWAKIEAKRVESKGDET